MVVALLPASAKGQEAYNELPSLNDETNMTEATTSKNVKAKVTHEGEDPSRALATANEGDSKQESCIWEDGVCVLVRDGTCVRPKRCLTAYNYFFQEERRKMLEVLHQSNNSNACLSDSNKNDKPAKIGFATMARTVSGKWKTIDPKEQQAYMELAAQDKIRYDREIAVWKKLDKEMNKRNKKRERAAQKNKNKIMCIEPRSPCKKQKFPVHDGSRTRTSIKAKEISKDPSNSALQTVDDPCCVSAGVCTTSPVASKMFSASEENNALFPSLATMDKPPSTSTQFCAPPVSLPVPPSPYVKTDCSTTRVTSKKETDLLLAEILKQAQNITTMLIQQHQSAMQAGLLACARRVDQHERNAQTTHARLDSGIPRETDSLTRDMTIPNMHNITPREASSLDANNRHAWKSHGAEPEESGIAQSDKQLILHEDLCMVDTYTVVSPTSSLDLPPPAAEEEPISNHKQTGDKGDDALLGIMIPQQQQSYKKKGPFLPYQQQYKHAFYQNLYESLSCSLGDECTNLFVEMFREDNGENLYHDG